MKKIWQYHLDHLIFWLATISFLVIIRVDLIEKVGWSYFLQEIIVRNLLLAGLIYVNLLYLIPRFLQNAKYLIYSALLIFTLLIYTFLKNAHDVYLFGYVLNEIEKQYFFANTMYNFSLALFYLAFSVTLQLSKEWFWQREQMQIIQLEKLNTELNYLKSQINPHFVFNTLNSIYFQIDKTNLSARNTLLKFAELLRYQLYECNAEKVPIAQEINYLQNYVALQKLRKDENYHIKFEVAEDLTGLEIAPLLLIPLVENAFKYVSHHTNQVNEIKINIKQKSQVIDFQIFNTKDDLNVAKSESKGIGLANVKRRLELLYKNQYELKIQENSEDYLVKLRLSL